MQRIMEDNKYYIVIAGNKVRHTTGGIDSARLWAKRYPFAVILECNTVPLDEEPSACQGRHQKDKAFDPFYDAHTWHPIEELKRTKDQFIKLAYIDETDRVREVWSCEPGEIMPTPEHWNKWTHYTTDNPEKYRK